MPTYPNHSVSPVTLGEEQRTRLSSSWHPRIHQVSTAMADPRNRASCPPSASGCPTPRFACSLRDLRNRRPQTRRSAWRNRQSRRPSSRDGVWTLTFSAWPSTLGVERRREKVQYPPLRRMSTCPWSVCRFLFRTHLEPEPVLRNCTSPPSPSHPVQVARTPCSS
jgi:hypothetical protein